MILREIMQVYDSSLLEDETPEQRIAGFRDVLEGTVDPMLTMCSTMGNMIKPRAGQDSNAWERATFMINCLVYIEVSLSEQSELLLMVPQSVLQPFDFTVERLQALESSMDDNVQVIVEAHVCVPGMTSVPSSS
jgi:conserved oligomeric Golgi complex subunit 6